MENANPNNPVQVRITRSYRVPPTSVMLCGIIDSRYFECAVAAATWDALPNIGAKQQFAAQALYNFAAALDTTTEPGLPGVIIINP